MSIGEIKSVSCCQEGKNCPYLDGGSVFQVLAERDCLKERVEKMERIMELATTKIKSLQEENKNLKDEKRSLKGKLNQSAQEPFKRFFKRSRKEETTKKKGAPVGHHGRGRERPERIDQYVDIWPDHCNHCGCQNITLYPQSFQEHIVQDIQVKVITTSYRTHYGYCPNCKRTIYPKEEASIIPKSRIGPTARAVSGYFHYIGIPYRKIKKIFNHIFGLKITHPTLLDFDGKIAKNGKPLYEQIKNTVRLSSLIHTDETGWPLDGENWQLWEFINKEVALYRIEKSRGSEIVKDTLGERYNGFLISDFYSSYNSIEAVGKQKCLYHLLDEVKKIEEENKFPKGSQEAFFCQDLKSILNKALESWNRFQAGEKLTVDLEELKKVKEITAQRLTDILLYSSENDDVQRIKKRIVKHNNELLTFLDHPEVEPTNNRAERGLRSSVIVRKITFGNRTEAGAKNHSIIMSIVQTGILNRKEPFDIFLSLAMGTQKTRAP